MNQNMQDQQLVCQYYAIKH